MAILQALNLIARIVVAIGTLDIPKEEEDPSLAEFIMGDGSILRQR